MMTRDEHLAWAKRRALEYLNAGEMGQAFTSMLSDLSKHPDLKYPEVITMLGMHYVIRSDRPALRHWIEGFN